MTTNSSQASCIICRNYDSTDAFAVENNLKKFWESLSDKRLPNLLSKEEAIVNQTKISDCMDKNEELEKSLTRHAQELQEKSKRLNEISLKLKELEKEDEKSATGTSSSDKRKALKAEEASLKRQEDEIKRLKEETVKEIGKLLELQISLEKKGQETVEAIGRALWQDYTNDAARANDNIARARLFCTWIASSFKFNSERAIRHGMRKPMEGFISGEEVCEGYCAIFVALFNTTNPSVTQPGTVATLAKAIKGDAKDDLEVSIGTEIEPQTKIVRNVNQNDTGHVWAAFPLEPFRSAGAPDNIKSGYKLIDPLWFQTNGSATWFMRSNQSFQLSHLPSSPGNTGLPDSQLKVDIATFWSRQLVGMIRPADVDFNVEPVSLMPAQLKLVPASSPRVDFSFRKACPHRPNNIAYYVALVGAHVVEATATKFELDADGMTWRATLDIKSVPTNHQVHLLVPIVDGKPYAGDVKNLPPGKEIKNCHPIAWWDVESKDTGSKLGLLGRNWGESLKNILRG